MRRLLPVLLSATLIAAACGSDSDADGETITATTEAAPATTEPPQTVPETTEAPVETVPESTEPAAAEVTPADLAASGPYAVGVTTRTLPEGGEVELWYPADESTRGGTDHLPRSGLPARSGCRNSSPATSTTRSRSTRPATPRPPPTDPSRSCCSATVPAAFRLQSSELAQHLASWGIVTASTDHPLGDDSAVATALGGTRPPSGGRDALDRAVAVSALDWPRPPSRPRSAAAVLALGLRRRGPPGVLRSLRHRCRGSDLIDLGEQAGLGDFLDEGIRRLATDGCDEPNRPVQEVWPGIFQGTTGFYRWVFGIDPEPIGLDESVVTDGVTITSK